MSDGHSSGNGARLRLTRRAHGFSQQQIAEMAGVSRQAISAVESGLSDPSLRVAIAVSRALGLTVEELFGTDETVMPLEAREVAPLGSKGARVTLALVGDGHVALPSRGETVSRAGFLPAGGLVAETGKDRGRQTRKVRPIQPSRPTLVAAGCDRVLPLLEAPLGLLTRRWRSPGGPARAGSAGAGRRRTGARRQRTCGGGAPSTTSARPPSCCPVAVR